MTFDPDLSADVAAGMRRPPEDKECFLNAFRASGPLAGIVGADSLRYVEGYADGCPHGWLETDGGRIVEVTPVWRSNPPEEYEAAHRHTFNELMEHVADGGVLPIENIGDSPIHPKATANGGTP